MQKVAKPVLRTTLTERITYGTYFFGQNILFLIFTMLLQMYLTNTVGMAATTVGVLFLVVKVWDAVNDPIFGVLIDKVRFKKGKYLPWIRVATFLIPAATVFMFLIPEGIPAWLKVIWAGLAYIIWDTAYTLCDAPIFALTTAMTDNIKERTSLITIGRFAALFAMFAVVIMPALVEKMGGYAMPVIILSVIAMLTMVPIGYVAKERCLVQSEKSDSLKDIFSYLVRNKYLLIFFSATIIAALTNASFGIGSQLAVYCLGGYDLIGVSQLLMLVPMLLGVAMVTLFAKKIDKFHIYFWGLTFAAVVGVIQYFVGYGSFMLYAILTVIKGLGGGTAMILAFTFTADCTEYGTYKTGVHAEGISFSIQTFSTKMTGALSTSIAMLILGAVGYISATGNEWPAQSDGVVNTIWFLATLFPVIGQVAQIALIGFAYKLRDKDVKIMADINRGVISRAEGDKLLSRKY